MELGDPTGWCLVYWFSGGDHSVLFLVYGYVFSLWWGFAWGLLGFVLFVTLSICSMIEMIFLLASLKIWRPVLKISPSVVFGVFSTRICGHSSSMCFFLCFCCVLAPPASSVPVVAFHIKHSCSCFEDCTGLFPRQFIHVFHHFSWFPFFLFSIQ